MGGIDLDPASCAAANEIVRATAYYTIRDDGLGSRWGKILAQPAIQPACAEVRAALRGAVRRRLDRAHLGRAVRDRR
jgi:hypothetical protein